MNGLEVIQVTVSTIGGGDIFTETSITPEPSIVTTMYFT
jgi:hypothetical protein